MLSHGNQETQQQKISAAGEFFYSASVGGYFFIKDTKKTGFSDNNRKSRFYAYTLFSAQEVYSARIQPALPIEALSQVMPSPASPKTMRMVVAPSGTSTLISSKPSGVSLADV